MCALKDSIIYSRETSKLLAYLYGFDAGYNATIVCKTYYECDIICKNNGTDNCNVKCDIDNGIFCPND